MKHSEGKVKLVDDALLDDQGHRVDSVDDDNGGFIVAEFFGDKSGANAIRCDALWNASDGMTNDEAVRYLEHGAEMYKIVEMIGKSISWSYKGNEDLVDQAMGVLSQVNGDAIKLLALMEGK